MNDKKNKLGLPNDTPMLDIESKDFYDQLNFAIWSIGGSSDYSNDRYRPYNGQTHTDHGIRGKTHIEGLTMRDVADCLIKAMLLSSPSNRYLNEDWDKCWDFSNNEVKPTQFLIDNQNDPDFISTKVELGTWRYNDVYKIDFNNVDPIAIAQNMTCEIEKMMGIFPNIPKLSYDDETI